MKNDLEWARNRPCDACKKPPPSDPAHIQSRKSGGPDIKANLWSLCRNCHVRQGWMGVKSFAKKYGLKITDDIYPRRNDL